MARSLEARIAKLEAAQGGETQGIEAGRLLAGALGLTGDALEAKAQELAANPRISHEQWIDILARERGEPETA